MRPIRLLLAMSAAAALFGCGSARNPEASGSQCTQCHGGTDNSTGAPPRDTHGNTDPSALGVGRHTAHLAAGLSCDSCHPARPTVSTPGHLDGNVDLAFGGLAVAHGATPAFDARTATCSNVYCHGSTLNAGGALISPVWTGTLGQPRCAQCHGFPPPAPHPQLSTCSTCHPTTVTADGTLIAGGTHLNGNVDLSSVHPAGFADRASPAFHGPAAIQFLSSQAGALQCSSCHGADFNGGTGPSCNACHASVGWVSPAWTANCTFCHGTQNKTFAYPANLLQAAPPPDVDGLATGPEVGAHQKHLAQSRGAAVACATCHLVPTQTASLAHVDGTATVAFSAPATGTYAAATQNCAVSCHSQPGAALPSPTWTTAGPLACDACHGAPPPSGQHPTQNPSHAFMGTNCGICHGDVAGVVPNITNPALHVNGVKDVKLSVGTWDGTAKTCATACHGTLTPFNW